MNRTTIALVALYLLTSTSKIATAYGIETHKLITNNALNGSVLVQDPQKLRQLGLLFSVDADPRVQGFPDSRKGSIAKGSIESVSIDPHRKSIDTDPIDPQQDTDGIWHIDTM